MPDPPIKQRLESAHFTNNPSFTQARLNNCLAADSAHIPFGQKGPWVTVIQSALTKIREKNIPSLPEITDDPGDYNTTTRDAVLEYKRINSIQREGQPLDSITGRATITRLDDEMKNIEAPGPQPAPPSDTRNIVDIIVKFAGTLRRPRQLAPDEVFPDVLLETYNKKTNRQLVRIGQTTRSIPPESDSIIGDFVNRVKASFKDKSLGSVFIYGSSSGGRNALQLGRKLTIEKDPVVPLEFVAIMDAAWFPNETTTVPNNFTGDPTNIPIFSFPFVEAKTKLDFFQTLGNHSENTLTHGRLFSSFMDGKEVHGDVVGFARQDLTSATKVVVTVAAEGKARDDDCHIKLTGVATPLVHGRIRKILDAL